MPQMYPTQWMIWANLSLLMFFLLMTLMKDVTVKETGSLSKMKITKTWKW